MFLAHIDIHKLHSSLPLQHKETTRNYDILAAAFTDVLNNLHNDYGLIEE